MTKTVETIREAGMRNAWAETQLGQRVFGVFPKLRGLMGLRKTER